MNEWMSEVWMDIQKKAAHYNFNEWMNGWNSNGRQIVGIDAILNSKQNWDKRIIKISKNLATFSPAVLECNCTTQTLRYINRISIILKCHEREKMNESNNFPIYLSKNATLSSHGVDRKPFQEIPVKDAGRPAGYPVTVIMVSAYRLHKLRPDNRRRG